MVRFGRASQRLRSQRGSIILFTMVVAAIFVVAIGALSSQLTSAMDRQATRILYNEYVEFVSSVRTQLEDPVHCANMLGGQSITAAITNQPLGLEIAEIRAPFGSRNQNRIRAGWESRPGGIVVESIRVRAPNFTRIRSVQFADAASNRFDAYAGEVIILPRVPSINVISAHRGYLRIPLVFLLQGNVIRGCHGPVSIAAQCMAIGGAFDWRPTAPPGHSYPQHRCHPDLRCYSGSSGLVTSPSSCQSPYRAAEVGLFPDGSRRYLCQWCNPYK